MMKQGLIWLSIGFIIVGCSSKEATELEKEYKAKKYSYKLLQNTERVQFKEDNVTKILLTATYINRDNFNNRKHFDEIFLIGLYDGDEEVGSLKTKRLSLELNGIAPTKITPLEKGNSRLKHISFISAWNQFYEVHFKYVEASKLTLKIKSNHFKNKILSFSKVARYQL